MATSPIRSSTRAGSSQTQTQAAASGAEPALPSRRRAAPDPTTPPPQRRRTSSGSSSGGPRRAAPLPTARAGTPDSLASMHSLSSFDDWAHQLSPEAAGRSHATPPASPATSPDRASDASLPSLRSLGSLGPWESFDSRSRDAASPLPSVHSLGSLRSWDPLASASASTRTDVRPARATSLDSVDLDADPGNPDGVQTGDVDTIERLIGLLCRFIRGEISVHIAMEAQSGAFVNCFDHEGQLLPRGHNRPTNLLHDRLDRLAEGGIHHRALHRRFRETMRKAGECVWNSTQVLMNAVMDACGKWGREPQLRKRDIADHVTRNYGPDAASTVINSVLKGGIFKAPEHRNMSAQGLRTAVASLAERGIERYATDLTRWRDFEHRQRQTALNAAEHRRRGAPGIERSFHRLIPAADKLIAQLKEFAEADHDSVSRVSGASKSATLLSYCDQTGAFTDIGNAFVDRVQRVDPTRADRLREASAQAVEGWLRRAADLVDQLTSAVRKIKSGMSRNAVYQAMPRETPRELHIATAVKQILAFDGNGFRSLAGSMVRGLATTLNRLHASDNPAHHASLESFRHALQAAHPERGARAGDPLADLMQLHRTAQARPPADARPGAALPAAGASALPPRPPRRPRSAARGRRTTPAPAQPPVRRAASPTPSMAGSAASSGPDLNDLPPTPDIDFLPPLVELDEPSASIDALFAANAALPRWLQPLLRGVPQELAVNLLNGAMELDAHLASLNQPSLEDLLDSDHRHLFDVAGPQRHSIVLGLLDRQAALRARQEHVG